MTSGALLEPADQAGTQSVKGASEAERSVLIVEDDLSLRPFWEHIFKSKVPEVEMEWATKMQDAEQLIRMRFIRGAPYDLVIADVFLEGQGTGIDLWNRYGEEAKHFIFVSGQLPKYAFLRALDFGCPQYLKKPFLVHECEEAVNAIFSNTKTK